jgi:hypothetical protein
MPFIFRNYEHAVRILEPLVPDIGNVILPIPNVPTKFENVCPVALHGWTAENLRRGEGFVHGTT